jgi:hypothetical protein
MGSGRWEPSAWSSYTTGKSYDTKTVDKIYTSRSAHADLNPHGVVKRESRDSDDNPRSTPLIVALDVTGSMGIIANVMAKKGLNTLLEEIYSRKPITDPHCMVMGIGDVKYDSAPLQATQFEADLRIAKQLENIFLENGGGGNNCESYALAWYFAAHHTVHDSWEKRQKKGYLFTIGDEEPTKDLLAGEIEKVMGYRPETDVDLDALLTLVSRQWEIFHIMVAEGSYARMRGDHVKSTWTALLGQRAIWLDDHQKLAEVIVSTIQIYEGADTKAVVDSWDGSTALAVSRAVGGLTKGAATSSGGLVTL